VTFFLQVLSIYKPPATPLYFGLSYGEQTELCDSTNSVDGRGSISRDHHFIIVDDGVDESYFLYASKFCLGSGFCEFDVVE
jgi:hypothetical protein